MEDILQIVNTLGFNAAFLLIMAYFLKYIFDRMQNTIDRFSETISENTKILTELSERISGVEKEHEKEE